MADDAVIDFRNFIPGVLDAPVYRADGTNRLSGPRYWTYFVFGRNPDGLVPPNAVSLFPFGTNEWAGYCSNGDPTAPNPVILPSIQAGERVWIQMRVRELASVFSIPQDLPPDRFSGRSELFSLVVSNTPTPMIGLKSFSLAPARIELSRQGDQLVLRWSAGDGTVYYDVETAASLDGTSSWRSIGRAPAAERINYERTWVSNWVLIDVPAGAGRFYRLRLLNP